MRTTIKFDWIKQINPYYWETLFEGEEIMFDILWNFDDLQWTEKNARITRECGMVPIELDGLIFVGLRECGMNLQPKVIYTQYKLTDWIEPEDVEYLKYSSRDYVEHVIGVSEANELYNIINTKKFI